jgi:hypothetical protein
MRVNLADLDDMNLMGDEDCGVGLHCRDCCDGGRPIAYYQGISPYGDEKTPTVTTIGGLIAEAIEHRVACHKT